MWWINSRALHGKYINVPYFMGHQLDPFAETESQKQQMFFVYVFYIIIHKEGKFFGFNQVRFNVPKARKCKAPTTHSKCNASINEKPIKPRASRQSSLVCKSSLQWTALVCHRWNGYMGVSTTEWVSPATTSKPNGLLSLWRACSQGHTVHSQTLAHQKNKKEREPGLKEAGAQSPVFNCNLLWKEADIIQKTSFQLHNPEKWWASCWRCSPHNNAALSSWGQ